MSSSTKFVSAKEYAAKVGVSPSTISKWLRQGKLNGQKKNGKWVIPADQDNSPTLPATQKTQGVHSKSKAQLISVDAFSKMTYLTPFGVVQWLKDGRLSGKKDDTGQWQVSAENLEKANVQRLLRS